MPKLVSPSWFHRRSVRVNTALGSPIPPRSVLLPSTASGWPIIWPLLMMKRIHGHVVGHGTAVAGDSYNWICLVSRIVKHGTHRLLWMIRFGSRRGSSSKDLRAIWLGSHLRRHRLPAHGLREISRDGSSVRGCNCLCRFPDRGATGGHARDRSLPTIRRIYRIGHIGVEGNRSSRGYNVLK